MLPDFPKVKADLAQKLLEWLKTRVDHYLGPLAKLPRTRLFEGDSRKLLRGDSEEAELGEMRQISAQFTVGSKEIPVMTFESLLTRVDGVAREMAAKMAEHTYQTLERAVQAVGNVTDAGGRQMTAQTILTALSSMQIAFRPDGTARLPEMHISPRLREATERALTELSQNPDLKAQLLTLLEAKREEWRAREASRNLVG